VEAADLVVAEVNPLMPRTLGDSFLHVDDIDALVPVEHPVLELHPEPLDAVSAAIGRHVATLIPHGATLQPGIGKIPHAVLRALAEHHDLGIHTEMLSDTVIDLVETGVVNGRKKSLLPGKQPRATISSCGRALDSVSTCSGSRTGTPACCERISWKRSRCALGPASCANTAGWGGAGPCRRGAPPWHATCLE
jgi:acyl-CoA hydrolase